jgi:glycosyltransferase involved in cell wall biosynthesis
VIQFVSGEYPPDIGGIGDYTASLRAALADLRCASTVVSRHQVGRWDARGLFRLLRLAPRHGVVHIQYQAAAFDLLGDICLVPLALRRYRPSVRTVTTFHDVRVPYLFPRAGGLRQQALRILASTSDAVVGADQRDIEALGECGVRIPIGTNIGCSPPEGYDRAAFRERLGLRPDDLAVVYFGLLNASKGLDVLLSTFERLHSARLLMLGGEAGASDPTDRDTARWITARLGPRVIRTGWLPRPELSAHLLAGDVALLPYADGASARRGSLLACAAHGLPIVSTLPAGAEVAQFIRAIEPDPLLLAQAVREVAANPSAWHMASRALADDVSWRRIAQAHVDLYDRLLKGPRR